MLSTIAAAGTPALMSMPTATGARFSGTDNHARPRAAKASAEFMHHITTAWSRLVACKMRRARRIVLCSLDDRTLKDIGMQRSEIDVVLRDLHARMLRWPV